MTGNTLGYSPLKALKIEKFVENKTQPIDPVLYPNSYYPLTILFFLGEEGRGEGRRREDGGASLSKCCHVDNSASQSL